MKLSIAFVAAVSAVPDDFELPEICKKLSPDAENGPASPGLVSIYENLVNCWFAYPNPSVYVQSTNDTIGGLQEPDSGYGNCGFQYKGESMTNSTCKGFAPVDPNVVSNASWMIGNAAFVAKGPEIDAIANNGDIVGLDMSGQLNIVQSWEVFGNDADNIKAEELAFYAEKSRLLSEQQDVNDTIYAGDFWFEDKSLEACKVADVSFTAPSCTYTGDYYPYYAIMITNQHAGDDNNNYAIANYGGKDNVFTVTLNTACPGGAFPHDENQATIEFLSESDKDICQFVVTVLKGQAQLFYFTISGANDVVNFFDVTIV